VSTLVLLRHGESDWNREKRFQGWTDVGLTDKGRQQAAAIGRLFADQGYRFDVCFTSRLRRARETLEIVLRTSGQERAPTSECWRLNERHYGALQGLGRWEAVRKYGVVRMIRWQRNYATPPPPMSIGDPQHPRNDPRYADVEGALLPSAESLADTLVRLLPCWNDAVVPALRENKTVLLVAHHNTLRVLLKHLEDIPPRAMVRVRVPIAKPLVFELDASLNPRERRYLQVPPLSAVAAAAQ
jgi:2,3-bisphosphoglycerate-dependent phosphoglycerate mutase